MKPLAESNLLIISDRYPHKYDSRISSFVKNQVDLLKEYFKNVYVLSLTPYVPKILSNLSFMHPRWSKDAYVCDYAYDNVNVYFIKYFNIPIGLIRSRKGDMAFDAAHKMIKANKLNFDLIHAHFTYPSGYVAAKLKEIYNTKFVLTVHEDSDWLLEEIRSRDEKLIYTWRSADKIIRVNNRDLNEYHKLGINISKLLTIPNGFSPDHFKPRNMLDARKELGLPIDKKIFVNIANLEEYKGQKYLINSMKTVLAARKDVMLYIVGEGSLEKRLRSMIREYDLQRNVILAGGNKPQEEIALWMQACDVFILPSISESFGIVQIEAMACGKPVVGTRNDGSQEIIINEKLGILVKQKDEKDLSKAALKALDTEWDSEYIFNYAIQFGWRNIAEKIAKVYIDILGED